MSDLVRELLREIEEDLVEITDCGDLYSVPPSGDVGTSMEHLRLVPEEEVVLFGGSSGASDRLHGLSPTSQWLFERHQNIRKAYEGN